MRSSIALLCIGTLFALSTAADAKKLAVSESGTVIPAKATKGRFKKTVKPDIGGNGMTALKADAKVAVPFFKVTFYKTSKAATESSSIAIPSEMVKSYQSITTELVGVDEETFQTLTNAAYDDLVGKLTAAGYEVINVEALALSPTYSKLNSKYPNVKKSKSTYTPDGIKYPGLLKSATQLGKVMRDVDAAVLTVDYHVYYAAIGTENESGVDYAKASIHVGQVAHVGGTWGVHSRSDARCNPKIGCEPKPSGQLHLQQTPYSTIPFGQLSHHNSAGTNVGNTINAVGSLLGGRSTRSRQNYTLNADSSRYQDASLDALKQANERLLNAARGGEDK